MPQLLALDECLGTSSGEGGLIMEGIELIGFDLGSEKRPLFFLAGVGAGAVTKLEAVGRDGPAAAQKDSAMCARFDAIAARDLRWLRCKEKCRPWPYKSRVIEARLAPELRPLSVKCCDVRWW